MKKLFALSCLVAAVFAPLALHAQNVDATVLNTGTNVIAASGTLSPASAIIPLKKYLNVGLQATFNLSGTGTGNLVFSFAKSVDGITYETVPSVTMTIAAAGTGTVCGVTNTSVGAVGYLKLVSVTNANTPSTVANLVVKSIVKPAE